MRIIYPKREDVVFREGLYFVVEWYYTQIGDIPAFEYFKGMPEADQDKLDVLVNYIADSPFGTYLPVSVYRIEDRENKIYAFKPRAERFFNFTTKDSTVIITNAYHKHSQKMTKQDLESLRTAVRFRRDYLRRLEEGTYYEA